MVDLKSKMMKKLYIALKELFSQQNEFFQLAKKGKRITHIALAIPMLLVLFFAGFVVSGLIFYPIIDRFFEVNEAWFSFYNLFVSFGFVIVFLWIWVRFFEERSFITLGFNLKGALKKYLKGFFVGILMLVIVIGLMSVIGTVRILDNPEPFGINGLGIVLLLLLGYIVQGASEEIIARGWQFQVIGARYKPWLGAVISSVIFALLHGLNAGINLLALINLALFAFLLIFMILHDKSIWAACGWHTAWNWTMENVFGLKVSGTEGIVSVFKFRTEGPSIITGGDFGPEASILTSIVLIGGMIYILVVSKNKSKINET